MADVIRNLTCGQTSDAIRATATIELQPVTHWVNAIPQSTDMVGDEQIVADHVSFDVRKCVRGPIVMGSDLPLPSVGNWPIVSTVK